MTGKLCVLRQEECLFLYVDNLYSLLQLMFNTNKNGLPQSLVCIVIKLNSYCIRFIEACRAYLEVYTEKCRAELYCSSFAFSVRINYMFVMNPTFN